MSDNRLKLLTAALLAGTFASLALAPTAMADRRSSLGGNLLIEDTDDVFIFPHTAMKYVRLLTVDLGLNDALGQPADGPFGLVGNAGLIIGDNESAFGFFSHRSDFINVLPTAFATFGDLDSLALTGGGLVGNPGVFPIGEGGFLPPLQWIDLVAAFNLGGSPLGVRLSVGRSSDNNETTLNDTVDVNENTATAINLLVGYGLSDGDLKIDVSGELSVGFQNITTDPDGDAITEASTSNLPSISVLARGTQKLAEGVDLGFIGLLDFRTGTSETIVKPGDNKSGTSSSTFGIDVGAGPVYHVNDRFTIAAYATIGFHNLTNDPETNTDAKNDIVSNNILSLPQLRLSGEFKVFEWLWLRTGTQFVYAFTFGSDENDVGGDLQVVSTSSSGSVYRWVSGVGIDLGGGLEINGTFNHQFVLDGPNFIGGGEGMFAFANLTYDFD